MSHCPQLFCFVSMKQHFYINTNCLASHHVSPSEELPAGLQVKSPTAKWFQGFEALGFTRKKFTMGFSITAAEKPAKHGGFPQWWIYPELCKLTGKMIANYSKLSDFQGKTGNVNEVQWISIVHMNQSGTCSTVNFCHSPIELESQSTNQDLRYQQTGWFLFLLSSYPTWGNLAKQKKEMVASKD